MATITLSLSSKQNATKQHEVLVEFWHGRSIHQRAKTNIFVQRKYWADNCRKGDFSTKEVEEKIEETKKWRLITPEREREKAEIEKLKCELDEKRKKLNDLKEHIVKSFDELDKTNVAKDWLKSVIYEFNFPKEETTDEADEPQKTLFEVFDLFLNEHKFSVQRVRHYQVVFRTIKRFELFKGLSLTLDNVTDDTLRKFANFLKDEHTFIGQTKYNKILKSFPESLMPKGKQKKSRPAQPRGQNTIINFMSLFRAFFSWANNKGLTVNDPFRRYKIGTCVYGTPYYITIEERNNLYHFDFSDNPNLACQRDIFVFQCLIGCRIGDLWAMTKSNLVNGAIEYIPRKTKEGRAVTVRVPLNAIATEIVERYKDYQGATLFPFTSQQQYNRDIKTMFRLAGLTRIVTVINPTTREEEQRPICDIASSHLARRCFVGNLYKKVKDPNLIGKLSGHKEGSRAFSRYREIDEETSKELVTMLE